MDFAAPHTGFVLAAYGLSAAVMAGMTVAIMLRHRRMARHLSQFEAKRAPRRRKAAEPRP